MKIYVASSWRNLLQEGIVASLRAAKMEVYDFKNPPNGSKGFSWRQIHPDWENWSTIQYREALKHPIAQEGFMSDKSGLDWADACVLVLPCGRSAHLEAGYMAGKGKPVYTLSLSHNEPELMTLLGGPPDNICCSVMELLGKLGVKD